MSASSSRSQVCSSRSPSTSVAWTSACSASRVLRMFSRRRRKKPRRPSSRSGSDGAGAGGPWARRKRSYQSLAIAVGQDRGVTAWVLTAAGAALAVGLELLEALAIVLAVGASASWRDATLGAIGAVIALAVAGVLVGPVILASLPLDVLRCVVGVALLLFGLEWLRKGVLRLAGRRSPSNSLKEYEEEREALESAPPSHWGARVVAFKGVALEGLEVVLIVAALAGGAQGAAPALAGAAVAVLAVVAVGLVLPPPLARLPESHLKYVVGLMLTSFGVFFLAEGLKISWPGGDVALLYVAVALLAVSQLHVRRLA